MVRVAPVSFESPAVLRGDAAGGDLAGTYPSPTVPGLTSYRSLIVVNNFLNAPTAATQALRPGGTGGGMIITATSAAAAVFYLDPADYSLGGRVLYYRLAFTLSVANVAPAANFTAGLYAMTAPAGAASLAYTATVIAASQVVVTAPLANSINYVAGTDVAFPAAGLYAVGVIISANTAANSAVDMAATVQQRVA
jgi:hypothetical protein